MADLPVWFFQASVFTFGAVIGSFLNVVIARLPEGLSVVRPPSRCPDCGNGIPWYLNVPVLSWLALRGRCASCKKPISVRYPAVELLTAVLFLAVTERLGPSLACLMSLILIAALIAITFIDIDIYEIPDEIVYPGVVMGVVLRPFAFSAPWWDGIVAALLGAGALWIVRFLGSSVLKQEAMGLGDVKLIAMLGAFLGPRSLLPVIMVASVSGAVLGSIDLLLRRFRAEPHVEHPESHIEAEEVVTGAEASSEDEEAWVPAPTAVPFGPYLSLGAIAYILFGPALSQLVYRGLTG